MAASIASITLSNITHIRIKAEVNLTNFDRNLFFRDVDSMNWRVLNESPEVQIRVGLQDDHDWSRPISSDSVRLFIIISMLTIFEIIREKLKSIEKVYTLTYSLIVLR